MLRLSKPHTQFFLLVAIVVLLVGIGFFFDFDQKVWIERFNCVPFPIAGTLFVGAYIGITFFVWFSKDLFKIVGALVFGPYWSTLFIWIAELANAAIFFNMSRRLGRAYVVQKFHLQEEAQDRTQGRGGVWHIFLLRTLPIIPFRILDLSYGLTSVPLRKYLLVSALAMPVRIFWVQFVVSALGGAVFNLPKAMAYFEKNKAVFWLCFLYLIVSVIIVVCLRRKNK